MDFDEHNTQTPQQKVFSHGIKIAIIAILTLYVANEIISKDLQEAQNKKIAQIDSDIKNALSAIDSLRNTRDARITDSLMQYPDYEYVVCNQKNADSLRIANAQIMDRAYNQAKNHSVTSPVFRNENIFTDFADVPHIVRDKNAYYRNKKSIAKFDKARANIDKITPQIQHHIDSATFAQIDMQQRVIDSLLNQKNQHINSKLR